MTRPYDGTVWYVADSALWRGQVMIDGKRYSVSDRTEPDCRAKLNDVIARFLPVTLSDVEVSAVVTALDFALMGEGEVFVNEDGDDDPVQVDAARRLLARLLDRPVYSDQA